MGEFFHETNRPETDTLVWEYFSKVGETEAEDRRRASSDFLEPKTRPLAVKLELCLELMLTTLRTQWGASSDESLARQLTSMAKSLGG